MIGLRTSFSSHYHGGSERSGKYVDIGNIINRNGGSYTDYWVYQFVR